MKALVILASIVVGCQAIAGAISGDIGSRSKSVFAKVPSSMPSHKIEIAYTYGKDRPISMSMVVPDRGSSDIAKGEMVYFKTYSKGKVGQEPMFLGLRMAAKHVRSGNNNFMWLSAEFNKLTGAVSSPLNVVKVGLDRMSKIRNPRDRVRYLASKERVDFPTPILSEESGVFYLPIKIGRDIVNYKKGKLKIKIRIR